MFHRVTLIGRVGQEPQMRYTPDGVPVTNFSVATTQTISKERTPECPAGWKESYNGRNWELTTWWRVTCWRGLAETVNQYLSKGRQVFVEGEVSGENRDGQQWPRIYTANDGTVRAANYEITARMVKFLGSPGETVAGPPTGEPPPEGFEEDELPF
ncbi:MAG: single-stranded DNA-binding protein [Anaerolineae bacterium]|jgi:single-strand DNA-binding protein